MNYITRKYIKEMIKQLNDSYREIMKVLYFFITFLFVCLVVWLANDTESHHLVVQASLKPTVSIKLSLNWQ